MRLADAPSEVAATTFIVHYVSQIAIGSQNNGNIWLPVAYLVAKLVKLNVKGLTTLRSKKTSTWNTIAFASWRVAWFKFMSPTSIKPIKSSVCLDHTKFSWIFVYNITIKRSMLLKSLILFSSSFIISWLKPWFGWV